MKSKSFLFLLGCVMLCCATAFGQRTFKHPGGILSASDLARIKQHVDAGDEPWASCWKSFQNENAAKTTYTAAPSAEIGGSNGTRQRAGADAYAAMVNAIEWHVTGKTAYADCAAKILTAWGNKLETANAELFQYPCEGMIVAAEMLRNTDGSFYSGWADADRDLFLRKVRTIMVPAGRKFCTYTNSHPSWYTPAASIVLCAGVLLDDEELYNEGYQLMVNTDHWGTMFGGSIELDGQMREMGRDNVHGGLTLGDITQACLFAWNQGDDLFGEGDNRLLKGMEYWCRYNTGHTDTPFKPLDCSGLDNEAGISFYYISTHNNGFRLRPDACAFEAVYHHYKEVKGLDEATHFPYLGIAVKLARPDNYSQTLGYGTMLFTINAETSPVMTEKPMKPQDFKAEDAYKAVRLSWKHPEKEDARGFRVYRSTNGTSFTLLATLDFYTNNEYKDEDVECGKTYYYKVQLLNKAGQSEMSDIVSATPQDRTDELPKGWNFIGVNSTAYGSGRFDIAQDSTFIVNGLGADIGGTVDTHGFIYKKVTGDATLTVRLVSDKEEFYKVGLIMRSTLSGNSHRVGLTLGEKGYRMLRTCTRTSMGGTTSWQNGTNYGKAPMWLRISRKGNTFTTSISRDNQTWHEVGKSTFSMPSSYYVGMASCTGSSSGDTYEAVFDHVSLTATPAPVTAAPSTPTGLKAEWSGNNAALITWYPVQNADSFVVYRSADGSVYDSIATVRTTHYTDVVEMSGIYYYKVAAMNDYGVGKQSSAKSVEMFSVEMLTGTVIGTSGSWNNNSSTTKYAAVDGNLYTFFDATQATGAWVGYDLGEDYEAVVTYVMFAPRKNYPARMVGGKFEVSKNADFTDAYTIATVTDTPTEGVLTKLAAPSKTAYRYLRYLSPNNGNCNVAEVQFYGVKTRTETSGIHEITSAHKNVVYYNLQGMRVDNPVEGALYVTSQGRKVIYRSGNTGF